MQGILQPIELHLLHRHDMLVSQVDLEDCLADTAKFETIYQRTKYIFEAVKVRLSSAIFSHSDLAIPSLSGQPLHPLGLSLY